jgi:DNA-binding response OmpR family regulator
MRILIVEDEPRMLELLSKGLYEQGFTVMTASDGESGLRMAMEHDLNAMVLDIGLPQLDGYNVMRELRAKGSALPTLMLTARDSEDEIIRGLDLGADDYQTKPFSFAELVLRLQAIIRPFSKEGASVVAAGELTIDMLHRSASRCGQDLDLTRLEFALLSCLVTHAGRCVARATIMDAVWEKSRSVYAGSLDVLVNALRAKLDDPFRIKLLKTVRGHGYLLNVKVDAKAGLSC